METRTPRTPIGPLLPNILYTPEFVYYHEELFRELRQSVIWDERLRARKTASFGVPYNYSGMEYPASAMPPEIAKVAMKLECAARFRANNCLINYYETGRSTMGFHSDATDHLAPSSGIAIVSLGSPRTLVFRHKEDKTITTSYRLEAGSLLVMPLEIQADWRHGVPKEENAGPRISLTFREVLQ